MMKVVPTLIIFFLLSSFIQDSSARTETFIVEPGTVQSFRMNLDVGDFVTVTFSVGGGSNNDINFMINGPAGEAIFPERRITNGLDYQFTAHRDGAYTLFFDNSISLLSEKIVTLETDVIYASSGGCLIATATFGSELAPQVQQLREIRENTLLQTASGSAFMASFNEIYYSFSPTIADWERQNPIFKELVKITITPMLATLSILNYVNIDSETEMLGYGIGIILMNIGMYFILPSYAILIVRKLF